MCFSRFARETDFTSLQLTFHVTLAAGKSDTFDIKLTSNLPKSVESWLGSQLIKWLKENQADFLNNLKKLGKKEGVAKVKLVYDGSKNTNGKDVFAGVKKEVEWESMK